MGWEWDGIGIGMARDGDPWGAACVAGDGDPWGDPLEWDGEPPRMGGGPPRMWGEGQPQNWVQDQFFTIGANIGL